MKKYLITKTDFERFKNIYKDKKINPIQNLGAEGSDNHYEIDRTVLSFYPISSERCFVFIGSENVKGIEKRLRMEEFNLQKIPRFLQEKRPFLICQLDAGIATSTVESERIEKVTKAVDDARRISNMGLDLYRSFGATYST